MKKLLLTLLLSTSLSTFADDHLESLVDGFCYESPKTQVRNGLFFLPNQTLPYSGENICVYSKNGQYHSQGEIRDGKQDGKWTFWFENGQKELGEHYKDGNVIDVTEYVYYENGQIQFKTTYKDGELYGRATNWYENGQKSMEASCLGCKTGEVKSWYENGQIEAEAIYKDGELDGKQTKWYENGQIKSDGIFNDGKLDGKETSWYENGQMRGESNYKDGKKDGKWTWWLSDGLKWKEAIFINDEIVGDCEYFNVAGPWDEYTKEGFLIPDLCPEPKSLPKGITLGDEIVSDQLDFLRSAYVNNIAARIKTFWRYQSAQDDWTCEVYVIQGRQGQVKAVDVRNCNVGNSSLAKSFRDSISRAVNKASPLPGAPDDAVFSKELYFVFTVK